MSLDIEAWISRCARRLIAINAEPRAAGDDWYEIAEDLHEYLSKLPPEFAAATFVSVRCTTS